MQIPLAVKEFVFLNTPAIRQNYNIKHYLSGDRLLLFTIAFNSLEAIQIQAEHLNKYLKDSYVYLVCDNSSNTQVSNTIKEFCTKNDINYIRLIGNPYNGRDASKSHGLSINWIYKHVIKPSNAKYFGVIDHDIFPIKSTSIVDHLKGSKVYGHIQERGDRWYLWPGFSFFNRVLVGQKKFNFMPIAGLDTGGGNWELVFRLVDKSRIITPKHEYIKYKDGGIIQSTSMERIGDWLHLINGSGWRDGKKKDNIKKFIQKALDKAKI